MTDNDIFLFHELGKLGHCLKRCRCSLDHILGDTGQFFCLIRDRNARIDHRREYISFFIFPVLLLFIADRGDLQKTFLRAVQTCGLDIECNK